MSKVRVLVGTRKGAFILTADGARKRWKVSGPHFAGWEIYHVKGSPVDPNRIYASQTSGWFGQIIQRSDDGGKTWNTPGSSPEELKGADGMAKGESNKFVYDGVPGTHQWYDGTQHPWEFKRVWHLEPSLHDPEHVYAGVEDAALFRIEGRRQIVERIVRSPKTRHRPEMATGRRWNVSAYNPPRSDKIDNEYSWRSRPQARSAPMTAEKRGNRSITDCIHNTFRTRMRRSAIAFIASPCIHRGPTHYSCKNIGTSCAAIMLAIHGSEVSGNLPSDFGFPIDVHAHEPETIYVVPIKSDSEHYPPSSRLRVYRSRTGGNEWEPLTKGLPQRNCYVNVLRDAMSVDSLEPCGIYFGTTGGQVYASADARR